MRTHTAHASLRVLLVLEACALCWERRHLACYERRQARTEVGQMLPVKPSVQCSQLLHASSACTSDASSGAPTIDSRPNLASAALLPARRRRAQPRFAMFPRHTSDSVSLCSPQTPFRMSNVQCPTSKVKYKLAKLDFGPWTLDFGPGGNHLFTSAF